MPRSVVSTNGGAEGFEGSMAGLGLSDVIQMNGLNRFSGQLAVEYESKQGVLFFRDGEIVHAEVGDEIGEAAFYEMMRWPGGKFELHPNVITAGQTIQHSWKFLLMESHRLMDESRRGMTASHPRPTDAPGAAQGQDKLAATFEKIRQIPGVLSVAFQTKDGQRVAESDAEPPAGGVNLARLGKRLGEIFGAGEIIGGVVQGTDARLLLLATKTYHLSILMQGDSQAGFIEAEIRKLLAPRR